MRMNNTNRAIFFGTTTGLLIALVIITIFLSFFFILNTLFNSDFIYFGYELFSSFTNFIFKRAFYTTKFINNKESYIP